LINICFFTILLPSLSFFKAIWSYRNKGMNRLAISFVIYFIVINNVLSQNNATVKGVVKDNEGNVLGATSISVKGLTIGTITNDQGLFNLKIPANQDIILVFSRLGYKDSEDTIKLAKDQSFTFIKVLELNSEQLEDVTIYGVNKRENSLTRIDIKSLDQLPNSSGNIETILKTLPGVASGNELSSQYSVRGGSFDENLIYVNDIEIYRPLLVQSAQQEGLSFINPSMVSSIQFSAGGFDAQYGDKLSSVLDIKYKRATEFNGSVMGSLLGGSAHIEGASKNNRFSINSGLRYKTTHYLLKTMDTKGDYKPSFIDFQTFMTYDISKKINISLLGNYASNKFTRIPKDRSTDFGTFQQEFNFTAFFEGQEKDIFSTYLEALSLYYHPNEKLSLKLIGTAFNSNEEITYDILTEYWLNIKTGGSSSSKDSLINIGVGSSLDHARNYLYSVIYSVEHKGEFLINEGNLKWGVKAQKEFIDDRINEWEMLDSAGYSLPFSDKEANLFVVNKLKNNINSTRISGYLQNSKKYNLESGSATVTLGVRASYWDYNKDITISPRGSIEIKPNLTPNLSWHFSTGLYYQPPFYKELRDPYGKLYPETKAQRAFHILAGTDFTFYAWSRPFIFTSEIYYKKLTHLIVYKLEDVKLQYLPVYNKAKGYATGIDFKIYGEFVPGTESWFSLSLLSTKEDIYNDYIIKNDGTVRYPGYYRRPTDQFMNFSLFFQDYLPSNPNFKVHLMVVYGSGFPYSGPSYARPSDTYKLGAYSRIDIGFSRVIVRKNKQNSLVKTIWLTGEILNFLDTKNKVSYDWVKTIESQMGVNASFAVPNYLTGRSLNLKISAYF
jgi:hypothetical protein